MTTSSSNPRVFISATSADLGTVRRGVKDALLTIDCFPVEQTNFAPDYRSVYQMLRGKIESCQAFIHIAGMRYGAEPDPATLPSGGRRRSFTQMEYDIAQALAVERGDEKFRVYCFVCPEDFPFEAADEESEDKRELQRRHRAAILGGARLHESPASTADLENRVLALREKVMSLEVVQQEVQQEVRSATKKTMNTALWILGFIAVLAVAFVIKLLVDRHLAGEVTRQVKATEAQVKVIDRQTQQSKAATEQVAAAADAQQRAAQSLGKVGGKLIEMTEDQLVESVSENAGLDLRELRQLMVLARRGKGLEAAAEDQLKSGRFASAYALSRIHGEDELGRDAPDFGAVARCFGLACEAMVRLERVRPAVEMAARSRQLFDSGVLDSERAVGAYARTLLLQGNSAHLDAMLITPAEALKTLRAALRFHEEAERVARKLQLHDLLQDALEGQARALAELARRDAVAEITVLHGRASEVIQQALALPEIDAKRRTRLSLLDLELRMRSAETAHEVDALAELAKVRSELEAMRTQAGKDESDDVAWRTSHLLARCKFAQANIFRMREFGCWRRQTRSEWIEERRWNYSPEALRWMASALEDVRSATQFAERLGQSLPWVESMVLSADILGAKGEEARAGDACRAVLHRMPKEKYPQTWIQVLCSKWQFETPVPQKLVAGQKPAPWEVEWPALDEFNTLRDELQKLVPDSTSQDWARIMAARTMFWLSAAGCIDKERLVNMQKYGDGWFNGLTLPVDLCNSARSAARAAQAVYTKELSPRLWMRLELLVNWGYISHCELGLEELFNWGAAEAVVSNVKDFPPLLDPARSPVEFARAQTLKRFALGYKASDHKGDEKEMAGTALRLLDVADRLWPAGWLYAEHEVNEWEKYMELERGAPLDAAARRELLVKLEKALAALVAHGDGGGKLDEKVAVSLGQVLESLKMSEPKKAD